MFPRAAAGQEGAGTATALPGDLTPREAEGLRLVAQGVSDREVAARLVVSPRTVHAHLAAIYGKLGVTSRTQATRWALEHGRACGVGHPVGPMQRLTPDTP